MSRLLHVLNGLLLTLLVGGSLYVYPDLPDRIPLHFGADGAADRWGERSLLSWMAMPAIAAVTTVALMVLGTLLPRRPTWINMPDRDRLLKLPVRLQRRVVEGVAHTLYLTAFMTLLMFIVLQYGAWLTATGGDGSGAIMTGLVLAVVGLPIVAVSALVVMQKRMDAAWREHQNPSV